MCLHQNTSGPQGLSSSTFKAVLTTGKSATIQSNWSWVGIRKFSRCLLHSDCLRLQIDFLVGEQVWPCLRRKGWGWKEKPSQNIWFKSFDLFVDCFYHGKKLHMQKSLRQMPIDTDFVITNLHLMMTLIQQSPILHWVSTGTCGWSKDAWVEEDMMFPLHRIHSYQFTMKKQNEEYSIHGHCNRNILKPFCIYSFGRHLYPEIYVNSAFKIDILCSLPNNPWPWHC